MFLRTRTAGVWIATLAVLGVCPALVGFANAEIVYNSPVIDNIQGDMYNFVPLANDSSFPGPPFRPIGSGVGDTITLGGTDRILNSVYLGLFNGGGDGGFTLTLYGGSDPNSAPLLGSAPASIGVGIYPNVQFDFGSQHINLPNTITFIVSGPADDSHGPLSGLSPAPGTSPNYLWYGPGNTPNAFVQDSVWANADAQGLLRPNENYLTAQFITPEPGSVTLLVCMLFGLGSWAILKKKLA